MTSRRASESSGAVSGASRGADAICSRRSRLFKGLRRHFQPARLSPCGARRRSDGRAIGPEAAPLALRPMQICSRGLSFFKRLRRRFQPTVTVKRGGAKLGRGRIPRCHHRESGDPDAVANQEAFGSRFPPAASDARVRGHDDLDSSSRLATSEPVMTAISKNFRLLPRNELYQAVVAKEAEKNASRRPALPDAIAAPAWTQRHCGNPESSGPPTRFDPGAAFAGLTVPRAGRDCGRTHRDFLLQRTLLTMPHISVKRKKKFPNFSLWLTKRFVFPPGARPLFRRERAAAPC